MKEMPDAPPPQPTILSYVPGRPYGSKWKFHKNIGHAKLAISNALQTYPRTGGRVYEWNGTEWDLLYDIADHTRVADLPWRAEREERASKARKSAEIRSLKSRLEELENEAK